MKRRLIVMLIALCLVVCALPTAVFAGNSETKITSLGFSIKGYNTGKQITNT